MREETALKKSKQKDLPKVLHQIGDKARKSLRSAHDFRGTLKGLAVPP